MSRLPIRGLAAATLAAAGLAAGVPALLGQEPQPPAASLIQSLPSLARGWSSRPARPRPVW